MRLFFAPLQGYTDYLYRNAHRLLVGGVDAYFSPFVRWDGSLRNKDVRDVSSSNNEGTPVVPQLIAADVDELNPLLDLVEQQGYRRVDFNMGCPFPLQTGRGRGSALLARPDSVRLLMEAFRQRPELQLSVKMRAGFDNASQGLEVVSLLNDYPLEFITIHPRLTSQQYKGSVDGEAFGRMLVASHHRVVFNGDVGSVADIDGIAQRWPQLHGVMVGRGLLARPTLASEWRQGTSLPEAEVLRVSLALHNRLFDDACRLLQGDQQVLARMRAFWEYQQPLIDKKSYKRLMRTSSLRNYEETVRNMQ